MSKYGLGLIRAARLTRRQLIVFALTSAVINGIVTACVGAWLAQTYATQQARRKSVEALANLIYERRTRAGMVVSSMRRNAPADEVQFRKRAYDEAYVDWNKNILLNLFVIREVGGDMKFAGLEKSFEDDLVGLDGRRRPLSHQGLRPQARRRGCRAHTRRVPDAAAASVHSRLRRDVHGRAVQADALVVLAVLQRQSRAQAAGGDQHQGQLHPASRAGRDTAPLTGTLAPSAPQPSAAPAATPPAPPPPRP